ncbi:YrhK family protein [Thalassobacillus devorans]|uniref:YrhK family protein n=1 Tax=Thalassobacillus devorans TaxID=279813 RepID=UPI00048EDD6F|nr:YrhK family protein [Thalassobacillus devorans]
MKNSKENYTKLNIGQHELFFDKPYELLYIINHFLMGVFFFVGSIFFYFDAPIKHWGTTLFVLGSLQMLIRPSISLAHKIHLKNEQKNHYEKD